MVKDHMAGEEEAESPLPTISTEGITLIDMVENLKLMTLAMQSRLLDPQTGQLKQEIPIREGKEAVSAISTLLGLILRNKEALESKHYQQQFDSAVTEVLAEMDEEHQTDFLDKLQVRLETIEKAA